MKRLHVHVGVTDLDRSIGFYSTLFAAAPTVDSTGPAARGDKGDEDGDGISGGQTR